MRAIQKSFLEEGTPRDLTLVHAAGQGGGADAEGNVVGQVNHLGEEGLLKKIIAGHYSLAPRIQKLALENKIAAYNMPQGCISELFREIAAHRPGLITHVGLNTFVDPDVEGGMLNDKAREEGSYVKKVNFNGEEKLFYPSFPIDVALIHASYVDTQGNCSLEEEGTLADILPIAQAAYTSGGKVIVTVEKSHYVEYGSLDTRFVQVPMQNLLRNIIAASNMSDLDASAMLTADYVRPPAESIKSATIVVTTLPILVVYPFIQKYFVKGVMVGSVKG